MTPTSFIGTARRGSVDPDLLLAMAPQPIVFALSNPEPELLPEEARKDALLATGRSDMPNQITTRCVSPLLPRRPRRTRDHGDAGHEAGRDARDRRHRDRRSTRTRRHHPDHVPDQAAPSRRPRGQRCMLSEHPDGRKHDMLAEPGSAFGMPDLPTLIPSDDRTS